MEKKETNKEIKEVKPIVPITATEPAVVKNLLFDVAKAGLSKGQERELTALGSLCDKHKVPEQERTGLFINRNRLFKELGLRLCEGQ